jgi:hypothetical protein
MQILLHGRVTCRCRARAMSSLRCRLQPRARARVVRMRGVEVGGVLLLCFVITIQYYHYTVAIDSAYTCW